MQEPEKLEIRTSRTWLVLHSNLRGSVLRFVHLCSQIVSIIVSIGGIMLPQYFGWHVDLECFEVAVKATLECLTGKADFWSLRIWSSIYEGKFVVV